MEGIKCVQGKHSTLGWEATLGENQRRLLHGAYLAGEDK